MAGSWFDVGSLLAIYRSWKLMFDVRLILRANAGQFVHNFNSIKTVSAKGVS
jgi:hypothetical protein